MDSKSICFFSYLYVRQKFYPQILKTPKANETDDIKTYCLCAVGSRDRSLSIWLTSFCRPISVVHDLFENPVMDITWSKEPIGLLCCSMDGTVAYLQLSNDEIGQALDAKELVSKWIVCLLCIVYLVIKTQMSICISGRKPFSNSNTRST